MKTFRIYLIICAIFWFSGTSYAENTINSQTVRFVQISDVHLHLNSKNSGSRMYKHSAELFSDAIKQVNRMKNIDFVVFTGDMIGKPDKILMNKFIEKANTIRFPWFCTTGNHDIYKNSLDKEMFIEILRKNTAFNYDKPYYNFRKDDFLFIFMDGTNEEKHTANGYFPAHELAWLESQIAENPDSCIVIFQHYPVVEPFKSSSHCVLNADTYINLLDKYKNIAAVISGHYHAAKVWIRNNVAHISSPALVQYPNAFRVIELNRKGNNLIISYDFLPVKMEDVRSESLYLINSVKLHTGKDRDQKGVILLNK